MKITQKQVWNVQNSTPKMTSDQIQFLSEGAKPDIQVDDIKVQVAEVENIPQARLQRFQEEMKINTTIEGVDISYLTKFVLPYADSYEKFDKWTAQEDIALL